jgi:CBS domain-containing protein
MGEKKKINGGGIMALYDPISPAVKNTPTIRLDDSLLTAAEMMTQNDASALIVKEGEELVGILTDMDVMDGIVRHTDLQEVKVADCMTECQLINDSPVKSPCVQLYEGENVKNALDVMSTAGVHHLLVSCEMGLGTCMVSIGDLLRVAIS